MRFYINFSDSAKFAEAAKNIAEHGNFVVNHSFFNPGQIKNYTGQAFLVNFKPLVSQVLSIVFRFFPASDTTVAISGIAILALSSLLTLYLCKKLSGYKAAIIATALFIINAFMIQYGLNFSTEILFVFEILLFAFLFFHQNRKARLLGTLPLVLMFYTRPQFIVFYFAVLIFLLWDWFNNLETQKDKFKFIGIALIPLVVLLSGIFNAGNINILTSSHLGSINIFTQSAPGTHLRGAGLSGLSLKQYASKLFYNTYNFLKEPSRLAPAGVFIFFILGFFLKDLPEKVKKFNLFTLITLSLFILSSALTLPNARYVHPIMPLVFISASVSLVTIIKKANLKLPNLALSIVAFFVLLPSIGHFTLDARFRAQKYNTQKPPVYREISHIMAQHIPKDHLIITNLDAWAAWYEGLTTMWFPLKPEMLKGYQDKVDYIVITNYKEHDADFALGEWREVVYSPEGIENELLSENYQVLTTFEINPEQIYENREFIGTILVSNDQQN